MHFKIAASDASPSTALKMRILRAQCPTWGQNLPTANYDYSLIIRWDKFLSRLKNSPGTKTSDPRQRSESRVLIVEHRPNPPLACLCSEDLIIEP
jgi:hypothetical protein